MPERFLASVLPQHEAAELYRLMVVGIRGVAVFLMDPTGHITVWNKAAEEMKGYTADDAIGQHLGLLYMESDREAGRPQRNLDRAARDGVFSEEQWRRRKDGSLFWAHIVITALRNESDELVGFSKVTMDLTSHKLLEQCTREKQEIDLILHAAEAGTWKWNIERDEVEVSRHLLLLLGYGSAPRMLSFDHWLGFIHSDERAPFRAQLETVRDKGGAPVEAQLRILHRDGGYRWYFLRAGWHQDQSEGMRMIMGACVEIDDLIRAEHETLHLLQQLRQERARFENILEQLPSGIMVAEAPSGKLTFANQAAAALLGRSIEQVRDYHDYGALNFLDAHGERLPPEALPLARAIDQQQPITVDDIVYQREDGSQLHLAVTSALIADIDGAARVAVAVFHDVSKLKHAELTAAMERERALVTLAAITDGVITANQRGRIASVNPAAERMTGASERSALGASVSDVLRFAEPGGPALIREALERCLLEQRVIMGLPHLTLVSANGEHFAVDSAVAPVALGDGTPLGAVMIFHDVTESKRLMRRLGFEASHDALTGLVNRREFEVRLGRTIERVRQAGGERAALLYLDLDQFKIVNDTCGHGAGDDLLKQLASSYSEHVRERDTLARIGGDEFALIVEHCDVEEALAVAHKILEVTRNFRYACKGRVFQLGVSIGLTPIDVSTENVEEAMRRADHACYIAKDRGRNRIYVHYQGELDFTQRRSDMHWVTRLTHAFQTEQLQLYCQPILSLNSESDLKHYEILLRLRNGRSAPVAPATFLPAAERYDVILKIDRWVLERTLKWLAASRERVDTLDMCSINLSRRSLADPSFHKFAADLIDASAVPANKLCFEITEHGAIADMQKTIAFIEALAVRGCRFSLDDFGTGMTSFSCLKQLPVDFIKIDGSFVQMMSTSQVDYEMVRFTNDISHMMGRKTIAEYVSDAGILDNLKQIGVDFAQGYCIGRPSPLAS